MTINRKILNLQEAAAVLNVRRHTMKRLAKLGKVPAPVLQVGNTWAFAAAEIEAFAARQRGNLTGMVVEVFDMTAEQAVEPREAERRLSYAAWCLRQLATIEADGGAIGALGQARLCLDVIEVQLGIGSTAIEDLNELHWVASGDSGAARTGLHAGGKYEAQRLASTAVHAILSVANNDAAAQVARRAISENTPVGKRLVETVRELRQAIGAVEIQSPCSAGNTAGA